ncbi:MAG: hypothetical protein H7Y07_02915 [Pyrinomonadaceae bacterium]|nr:hypothetical protein [Sphingobacteriaceae bacterium]
MNKKILYLIISCIALATLSYSQQAPQFYFLKNNGLSVKSKEKSDFFRVLKAPDSGSVFYNLLEFYPDDSKKMVGKVSKYDPFLVFEGQKLHIIKMGIKAK